MLDYISVLYRNIFGHFLILKINILIYCVHIISCRSNHVYLYGEICINYFYCYYNKYILVCAYVTLNLSIFVMDIYNKNVRFLLMIFRKYVV